MKWIYLDGKFLLVQNCVQINFTSVTRENEYVVTMVVQDVNKNIEKCTHYSKVDKLSVQEVRSKFYDFIMDSCITMFNFYDVCKTIEQLNE